MIHADPRVVVCESFVYQRRPKVDLSAVEIIGVAKLWCQVNDQVYVPQTPSTGKKFWTDQKLKSIDMWVPGQVHAMDATRHLLYYLTWELENYRWIEMLRPEDDG